MVCNFSEKMESFIGGGGDKVKISYTIIVAIMDRYTNFRLDE